MNANNERHQAILETIARKAMLERGLLPDFSDAVHTELEGIQAPAMQGGVRTHDLRGLSWASIDNDDSLDLDQLTTAEEMSGDRVRVLVAVADVDLLVKNGSAMDEHARHNTTSVYTAARIFPMLPEKLSTDFTSLNLNEDRMSVVVEMIIGGDGTLMDSDVYQGRVCNKSKLAYDQVAAWLDGKIAIPGEVAGVDGLAENLRLQDRAAQRLKYLRHDLGALSLETIEARPVFDGDQIRALDLEKKNRAKEIIEDFMIAANGVTARYLSARAFPSIRRVVRTPKRWERIVDIAAERKYMLPTKPNSKALDAFLLEQKKLDPESFPDLSLAVIKLLGSGEYIAEFPGGEVPGHFGLAVKDYGHSTAPNRRYPDLITQRLLKAAINGKPQPYSKSELDVLAAHCTATEDLANKVERQVGKSAAALLLETRIGEQFDSIVTGASQKGTWVRILNVPVEGKLVSGEKGTDVGDRIRVELLSVDIQKGFIDFKKVD